MLIAALWWWWWWCVSVSLHVGPIMVPELVFLCMLPDNTLSKATNPCSPSAGPSRNFTSFCFLHCLSWIRQTLYFPYWIELCLNHSNSKNSCFSLPLFLFCGAKSQLLADHYLTIRSKPKPEKSEKESEKLVLCSLSHWLCCASTDLAALLHFWCWACCREVSAGIWLARTQPLKRRSHWKVLLNSSSSWLVGIWLASPSIASSRLIKSPWSLPGHPPLLSHPITSFSKGDPAKIILIIRLQLTHHSTVSHC